MQGLEWIGFLIVKTNKYNEHNCSFYFAYKILYSILNSFSFDFSNLDSYKLHSIHGT